MHFSRNAFLGVFLRLYCLFFGGILHLKFIFHLSIKCPTMKLNTLFQEPQVQRVLGA